MAELLGMIGELFLALMRAGFAWLQAFLEGLMVLFCFLFSKNYRTDRLNAWKAHPKRRFLDIGLATIWMVIVIGLPMYFMLPSGSSKGGEPLKPVLVKASTNEDLRVELRTTRTNDQRTVGTISVKKDGVLKIVGTETLNDLKTQLFENVKFESSAGPNTGSNEAK